MFIAKHYIFEGVNAYNTVLISFTTCLLLAYKHFIDFSILTLDPVFPLHWLLTSRKSFCC